MVAGRPTLYSEEIVDRICHLLSTTNKGVHKICEEEGMPCVATVFNWLNDPKYAKFLDKYAHARRIQAELLADEIISISDDSRSDTLTTDDGKKYANSEWINRDRLRVDARKWKASKLWPKKYGDRMEVDIPNNIIKVVIDGDTPAGAGEDNK